MPSPLRKLPLLKHVDGAGPFSFAPPGLAKVVTPIESHGLRHGLNSIGPPGLMWLRAFPKKPETHGTLSRLPTWRLEL